MAGKQVKEQRFRGTPQRNVGDVSLQTIFGLPPDCLEPRTNEMIKKSMPVVSFFPSVPVFQRGLDLFHIDNAWKEYSDLLKKNGFVTNNNENSGIQIAFLADNFPTDSFTNEYGENFLQKFTNIASEGAASIAQIMGAEKATDAYFNMQKQLSASQSKPVSMLGNFMEGVGNVAGAGADALSVIPAFSKGLNLVNKLMAGQRIDFPMVWKSSGFQPSYSLTCRLYNPVPQSKEATEKYIIGPIVAMMLMAVPRARDSATYTWPFLHRIVCPGIYELNPGFISNITVVKGGDQQQISLQQRMGIVDVRIDVGSLYSSMMGGYGKITSQRPTVYDYATALAGENKVSTRVEDNDIGTVYTQSIDKDRNIGVSNRGGGFGIDSKRGLGKTNRGRGISPKRHAGASDTDPDAYKSRVSAAAEEVYGKLKDLNPFD